VDADPKPHLLGDGSIRILFGYGVLDLDSTLHGINGAGEIGDAPVGCCPKNPAP
jgi:hypothetical protein